MVDFRTVVAVFLLGTLILSVTGETHQRLHARKSNDDNSQKPCKNNGNGDSSEHPCDDNSENSKPIHNSEHESDDDTTVGPATSETARWCRFSNGTYFALGQTFMKNGCTICQCTKLHIFRCAPVECLPTYCIDNKMPIRKPGQCCAHCDYEPVSNQCVYNGLSYSHGVIIKTIDAKVQCWCQLGNIECRNSMGSAFEAWSVFSNGTTIYIIVIIIISVLLFGLLLCCGCTLSIYYCFQKNQHEIQQVYDQYFNQTGWEPMNEEGEVVIDNGAEEKQAEAEKYQSEYVHDEAVPPPYQIESLSYVPDDKQK